jgi:lipopolysaccharide export system protein LptA
MRVTVERLRGWIVVLAGVLVAVILLFLGLARWRTLHLRRDLPSGLGVQIQESASGYTFSKSERGHTMFTLHAARTVQFRSGTHAELHDVSITVYAPDGAPADRIYGRNFEYDPSRGIAHAEGQVLIDLQGATGQGAAGPAGGQEDDGKNIVHAKTSDLYFNQNSGLATTTQRIEFRVAQASGSAMGASFDSSGGLLTLDRDVRFNSSFDGDPLTVQAAHGQFDRVGKLLILLSSTVDYRDNHGSADHSTVYFRPDGSASRMEAQGHVKVVGPDGQQIVSQAAHVTMNERSQPQRVTLDGGLLCVEDNSQRSLRASAASGILHFNAEQQLSLLQLRNAVSVEDRERSNAPAGSPPATRTLRASAVDVDLQPGPDNRPKARHIVASGPARVSMHTDSPKQGAQDTAVEGDTLIAALNAEQALTSLRGEGHTKLALAGKDGARQSSSGDTLLLTFDPPPGSGASGNRVARGPAHAGIGSPAAPDSSQLRSAVQEGNVTLIQDPPPEAPGRARPADLRSRPGNSAPRSAPSRTTATARRLTYDATSQLVRLAGDPRIEDASGELAAESIAFDRSSGDAAAEGKVQATFRQDNGAPAIAFPGPANASSGSIYVVAERAHLDHGQDLTTFYGSPRRDARLWQEGNLIAAPVLELSRARQTLVAHGARGGNGAAGALNSGGVTAIFSGQAKRPAQSAQSLSEGLQSSTVTLESGRLEYAAAQHVAVFSGGATAHVQFGVVRSAVMKLYLVLAGAPATPGDKTARLQAKSSGPGGSPPVQPPGQSSSSQIDRIVATGGVVVEQPGRKATGERLVYTEANGNCVLTGAPGAPPRLIDAQHGAVTGASLIFNDRDDSVFVEGGESRAATDTRVAR